MSRWQAEAPSNIALIKYMGKSVVEGNQAANPSLSYAPSHLYTRVVIEANNLGQDQWQVLKLDGFTPLELSVKGQDKFLRHFARLKEFFNVQGNFTIRSANNFPSDCGIASSASSFAALTKATHALALEESASKAEVESLTLEELSSLSRMGSGSSCRSFFQPWALWRGGERPAEKMELPYEHLLHQVILVDDAKKAVSTSEAHLRVNTSALMNGRVQRAQDRLKLVVDSLNRQDWRTSCEIVWAEFWDMHALFETSQPAFGYMSPGSLQALRLLRAPWSEGDGPMLTMDAGANVHAFYRPDQKNLALDIARRLKSTFKLISSPELS